MRVNNKISSQGQVVIILLLIMTVSLAIGLSIIGRSISDISTSTNVENSSRAFSAAEAGIEKAMQQGQSNAQENVSIAVTDLGNNASADATASLNLPLSRKGIEYPPIAKDSVAQFWLSNLEPNASFSFLSKYTLTSFKLYFGDSALDYSGVNSGDKPAVEVNVILTNGTSYLARRYFIDSDNSRADLSRFGKCTYILGSTTLDHLQAVTNENTTPSKFYCSVTIDYSENTGYYPVIARVRPLLSNKPHPIALISSDPSSTNGILPWQANVYTSTGSSGNTQRKIRVFETKKNIQFFFDYALFSASQLSKTVQ